MGVYDYGSLLDSIWTIVAIHSHHQQQCENYVQMSALISKKLAISISLLIRRFNQLSLDRLQDDEPDPIKRARLRRVREAYRTNWLSDYIDSFFQQAAEARDAFGLVTCTAVLNSIRSGVTKVCALEKKSLEAGFENCVKKDTALRKYAAEKVVGYTDTALMDGKIVFSAMTKKTNREGYLNAEIIARKIPTEMAEFISECGNDQNLDKVQIKQKQYFLRLDEAYRSMKYNLFLSETAAIKSASAFAPISRECQQLLEQENTEESYV
jgi:hypothetical protein